MSRFPFIDVEGSNYVIGYEIGKKCRPQTNRILASTKREYLERTGSTFERFDTHLTS